MNRVMLLDGLVGGRENWCLKLKFAKTRQLMLHFVALKRSIAKDGVLAEVKKRKHYEKPSVKRKKKSEAARKRKF
ncbi:hypothetical protein HMSSN036_45940 [Paenibacillus macerans]|nr:hypothetical protein HMSSN036_45940 [Paenibacillus macerans]GJM83532.1 hypothetical protein HMSSN139_60280 [Paenibacillus sp. HMSSN-139]